MGRGPKKPGSKRADSEGDDTLSPRAREVKRLIDEGRYKIDLDTLARRIVESGVLDEDASEMANIAAREDDTRDEDSLDEAVDDDDDDDLVFEDENDEDDALAASEPAVARKRHLRSVPMPQVTEEDIAKHRAADGERPRPSVLTPVPEE